MRIFFVCVMIFALIFALQSGSYAASIDGFETIGKGKFGLSLSTSFLTERELEHTNKDVILEQIKEIEMDGYQILFKPAIGLTEDIDIFLALGMQEFDIDSKGYFFGVNTSTYVDSIDGGFAYGFGAKGKQDMGDGLFLGSTLQLILSDQESNSSGVSLGLPDSTTYNSAKYTEWDIAVYLGKKFNNFLPYFGGKYSNLKIDLKESSTWVDISYEADNNLGLFLGLDYTTDSWNSNIEIRFLDELALGFGTTFKF